MPQLALASHTLASMHASSSTAHLTFVPFLQLPGIRPLLCLSLLWIFLSHTPRGLLAAHDPWRTSGSCTVVGGFVFSIGLVALLMLVAILAYPLLYSPPHLARGAHSAWASLRNAFESLCIGLPWVGAAASILAMLVTLGPPADCWHDQPLREWAVMDAMAIAALCAMVAAYSFLRYPAVSKILLASHSAQGSHGVGPPASPLLSGRHELKSRRERLHRAMVELAHSLLVARSHLRKFGRVWLCAMALLLITAEALTQRSYHQLMLRSPHFTLVDRPAPCQADCGEYLQERRRGRACVSGDMQRMPVEECLAQDVSTQLSRHHEIFDACKEPGCSQHTQRTHAHATQMHTHTHSVAENDSLQLARIAASL